MDDDAPPSRGKRFFLAGFAMLCVALFGALCIWQIERRAWKLALIDAVDKRVHAVATPAPGPADWPGVTAARDQYRHVAIEGRLLNDRETLVQALTEQGLGYWVLTPLQTPAGYTVLINRGYVPEKLADPRSRASGEPAGPVRITGLLRITEPKGRIFEPNEPAQGRWFSRDVGAIAKARGLGATAPYFIDADATPNPGGWPLGGLTVISFPNNHLVYAITWFCLALLSAYGAVLFWREKP
ncbi:SURF1 family protein [Sphingomonas oligoaromativorans]|uniref:SURF1 family protein n=1 Tax=Sphingomonas oligoaromativorans TaxID=575322 RepID=UPI001422DCF1|nr:SURF1 family protein [Sphingomonas oligoaromativorans]NIJ35087.1 surfeit locus 1 family protein [Sphingomonas oligoaromativorans]